MWPFKRKRWGGKLRVVKQTSNAGEVTYSVEILRDLTWASAWQTLIKPPLTLEEATRRADSYYQSLITEKVVME